MQSLGMALGLAPQGLAAQGERAGQSAFCAQHQLAYDPLVLIGKEFRPTRCPQCVIAETHERAKEEQSAQQRKRAQDEAKKRREELEQRLQQSLIPTRFADYTLDGFPTPAIAGDAENLRVVLSACRSYVNTWTEMRKRGTGLVFVGANGRGKTGLACGIANTIMREYNATALFMSVRGVIRHQADTWGRKGKTEAEALKELVEPDLLIIDEAGVQAGTEMEMMLLTEAINGRYAYRRPTFLISNLPLADYHLDNNENSPKQKGLRSLLGSRIWSRFEDDGTAVLRCNWPTLRGGQK
jgi:DNA replication protein DnaC